MTNMATYSDIAERLRTCRVQVQVQVQVQPGCHHTEVFLTEGHQVLSTRYHFQQFLQISNNYLQKYVAEIFLTFSDILSLHNHHCTAARVPGLLRIAIKTILPSLCNKLQPIDKKNSFEFDWNLLLFFQY